MHIDVSAMAAIYPSTVKIKRYLKLMSDGILHYLCSAELLKCFFQLILSIFVFSRYFI